MGNIRAMYNKSAGAGQVTAIMQSTDYYPFGKSFENVANTSRNLYLYNSKELQGQVVGGTAFRWYGYGARFYDTEIGRFHSIDKMSETTPYINPYRYAFNNPLRFLDVNGNFEMYASQTQQY